MPGGAFVCGGDYGATDGEVWDRWIFAPKGEEGQQGESAAVGRVFFEAEGLVRD